MDTTKFVNRHIGITAQDMPMMLNSVGANTLNELIQQTIPAEIWLKEPLNLPDAMSEREYAEHIGELGSKNEVFTSYIGMGWYDTVTPTPIQRHVFENAAWYTSYTPYQAEVSQGRLEALFNFQTMICSLTALPLTNCSLLDEATAAAEAATMMFNSRTREQVKANANILFVDENVFESTQAVLYTRMIPQGIEIVMGDYRTFEFKENAFGAIVQFPDGNGSTDNYQDFITKAHDCKVQVAVGADIMSLVLLTPPGEWGADIAFGNTQRFGIPMFYGGPSAGYISALDSYKRMIPGRIIGISKDANNKPAYRLALQTREQHIKREKATSNICTAQALLATMASFYAVYHGTDGLIDIATRIHSTAGFVAAELTKLGYTQLNENYFDTLKIQLPESISIDHLNELALECRINLRYFEGDCVGISIDETTQLTDVGILLYIFSEAAGKEYALTEEIAHQLYMDASLVRNSEILPFDVFQQYHSETELMRYIKRLERKDISLAHSMISLGSCTMKLNAASELLSLSNAQWNGIHPYAPEEQAQGYMEVIENLALYLAEITGLPGVSFQPNSGAAGEYAGLRVIREYLKSIGQGSRHIVLLPASAHGTNPASAVQAGYKPVIVACDALGNVDMADFRAKAELHKAELAACMITYPSTHGIFETSIVEICNIIHDCGGQLYMDGANMNGQVGITNPGFIGADICHLNLHKTFAIPHGGGGPGVGPICVAKHLISFLPSHPIMFGSELNTVSAAPYGSAGILPITYGYIRMMGAEALRLATETAILNANYLVSKLKYSYGIVYTGAVGRVGHELILECRNLKELAGITESDVAKRLMDFGYHAPTLSFPVHGTLMIEPTESESLAELNRFVDVMRCIWSEIEEIASGKASQEDNVLINAPHPEYEACSDEWKHAYPRSKAIYPLEYLRENKFWLSVGRIDNAFGDRNLVPALTCCTV
jgi:glycine dehydrogenase